MRGRIVSQSRQAFPQPLSGHHFGPDARCPWPARRPRAAGRSAASACGWIGVRDGVTSANLRARRNRSLTARLSICLRDRAGSLRQEESMFEEFKKFALKGNVVDLAVAVIIGAAFGKIV